MDIRRSRKLLLIARARVSIRQLSRCVSGSSSSSRYEQGGAEDYEDGYGCDDDARDRSRRYGRGRGAGVLGLNGSRGGARGGECGGLWDAGRGCGKRYDIAGGGDVRIGDCEVIVIVVDHEVRG